MGQLDAVKRYYSKRESRWGYRLLLGGNRHFGYYRTGQHTSMRHAQHQMETLLGSKLACRPNSYILDAGCGEGHVALTLARDFRYRIHGIDILPFSIDRARSTAAKAQLSDSLTFSVGDYTSIDAPDSTYDAIYTMETLVHALDYNEVLKEFYRVLKPGGHLVLVEYSVSDVSSMPDTTQAKIDFLSINERAAMYSLPSFIHGSFPSILRKAGFVDASSEDITDHVVPMLRRFYQIALVPYTILSWIGTTDRLVNAASAVAGYRYRRFFRYNVVSAFKPLSD